MSSTLDIHFLPLNRQDGVDQDDLQGVHIADVPRNAERSRKNDRLAVYLSFENPVNLSPVQIKNLLSRLENTYYQQSGTVTSAMKVVIQELNELLLNQNLKNSGRGQQMVAYLYMAVVRGEHLYISQSGPIHSILIKQNDLDHFFDPQNAGRGLGVSRAAGMRFFQAPLVAGNVFIMTPSVPKSWKESTLSNAFGQSLSTLKRRFLGDAGLEMQGVVMLAKPGKGAFTLLGPEPEPGSMAVEQGASGRSRPSLLNILQKKDTEEPASTSQPEPVLEDPKPFREESPHSDPVIRTSSLNPGVESPADTLDLDDLPTQEQSIGNMDMPSWLLKGGRWLLINFRKLINFLQDFLRRALPSDDDGLPTSAFAIVAVAVPLVVVAVSAVVYWQLGKSQQYDYYFTEAERSAELAQVEVDPNLQRIAWEAVITNLNIAEQYYVTSETTELRQQAQVVIDDIDEVRRLDFQPAMSPLSTTVQISRIVATQRDLFLLDKQSGTVMRAWLTGTGYEIDSEFRCRPGQYGNLIVGKIIDITNFPQAVQDNSKIFAMDENGILLICGEDTPPLAVILTPPDNNWGTPTSLVYENNNIYVLDPLSNAVWIYFGSGDNQLPEFPDPPSLFFLLQVPNMQGAIDIALNRDDLYILFADSHLVTCTFSDLPEAPTHCEDPAVYIDSRPGTQSGPYLAGANLTYIFHTQPPEPSLYFLDPYERSFYHFTLRMNLIQHYKPQPGLPLGEATALAISPTRAVFMAIENQIYQAFLP